MQSDHSSLPDSPAFHEERACLPEGLRSEFDSLVETYRFYAFMHYERPFVSYKILADLVRDGWRPAADPIPRTPST
jgi:hypothetical protein